MSVVIPSLRGAIAVPGWAKNDLWRRARAVPSLDLRFADNKSLTDAITGSNLVTFTRASSGTYTDSAGVLQTAATDVPRFDHDPTTGESLGLLVEEQRTNSITNNTMVGAVAGTPGTNPTGWFLTASANGISPEIVGTGVEDGITYVDIRYSGTSTGASSLSILASLVTAITAATGQSWTGSAYVKLQSGSLSNLTNTLQSVNGRSAVGAGLESTNAIYTPTSDGLGVQRRTVSITLANASTERISHTIFNAAYASGVAIDITLRIGLPQLEQGAFATSPILTSTAAATRSADVASITGSAFSGWYRQDEGTVFGEGVSNGVNGVGFFTLEDGSAAEYSRMGVGFSLLNFIVSKASGSQADVYSTGTSFVFGAPFRGVAAYALNNVGLSLNGANAQVDTTADMPSAANVLKIGFGKYATYTNGTIKRLTYWPQRLANSTLQQITQ
jgi:hypothetical protein